MPISEKINNIKDISDSKEEIGSVEDQIKIMKLMRHITTFRLIALLLIFPKLSLTELSSLLGRSKATVSHHLNKIESTGLIKTTTKEARGSIDAKVYELKIKLFELTSFNLINYKSNKNEKETEISNEIIQRDKIFFEILSNIFEQSRIIYEDIEEAITNKTGQNVGKIEDLNFKNLIKFDIWLLNEEQREKYEKLFQNFRIELMKILKENNSKVLNKIKPYLILHSMFPFEEMTEYDTEKKPYKKFFKALG